MDEIKAHKKIRALLETLGKKRITTPEIVHHFLMTGFPIDIKGDDLKISHCMERIGWLRKCDPVTGDFFYEAPVTYWVGDDKETTG